MTEQPTCPEGCSLKPWKACEHGYRYVQVPPVVHTVNSTQPEE